MKGHRMTEKILSQERLKELLEYDKNTGLFKRKVSISNRSKNQKSIGYKNKLGYIRICVDSKAYLAHRLAWLYEYGVWPKGVIDHIDRCTTNNCIKNLRDVRIKQNLENRDKPKNNTSGYKGVSWSKSMKKWIAMIGHEGKQIYLGKFVNVKDAAEAYKNASNEFHLYRK